MSSLCLLASLAGIISGLSVVNAAGGASITNHARLVSESLAISPKSFTEQSLSARFTLPGKRCELQGPDSISKICFILLKYSIFTVTKSCIFSVPLN